MDIRTRLKTIATAEQTSLKSVIEQANASKPKEEQANYRHYTNALFKKTIRFDEVAELLDVLGYDLVIRSRTTGKEY